MEKFFVFFCIPAGMMKDWMANVAEGTRKEQSDKMMQDWKTWTESHKDSIVDAGSPLGKTKRVTRDAIADVNNDLVYMMIMQGESQEAVAEIVKTNPHFEIPGCYVDVVATGGGM